MDLQKMVSGVRNLDDSLFFIELKDSFHVIGGEKVFDETNEKKKVKDMRYTLMTNFRSPYPKYGDNGVTLLSTGRNNFFTKEVLQKFREYVLEMPNLIGDVKDKYLELYNEIAEPLEIRTRIDKGNVVSASFRILSGTVGLPITIPTAAILNSATLPGRFNSYFADMRNIGGPQMDEKNFPYVRAALGFIPGIALDLIKDVPKAAKDLLKPRRRFLKVCNKRILESMPRDENYIGVYIDQDRGAYWELNKCGEVSSSGERLNSLEFVFSNGFKLLELDGSAVCFGKQFVREQKENYQTAGLYLESDGSYLERLVDLNQREEDLRREFRKEEETLWGFSNQDYSELFKSQGLM